MSAPFAAIDRITQLQSFEPKVIACAHRYWHFFNTAGLIVPTGTTDLDSGFLVRHDINAIAVAERNRLAFNIGGESIACRALSNHQLTPTCHALLGHGLGLLIDDQLRLLQRHIRSQFDAYTRTGHRTDVTTYLLHTRR